MLNVRLWGIVAMLLMVGLLGGCVDLQIKNCSEPDSCYIGFSRQEVIPTSRQTKSQSVYREGSYDVLVGNGDDEADSFTICAQAAPDGWQVRYYLMDPKPVDITKYVTDRWGWDSDTIPAESAIYLRVTVRPDLRVKAGQQLNTVLYATGSVPILDTDAVRMITTKSDQ